MARHKEPAVFSVRTDKGKKAEFSRICRELGITMSSAVQAFIGETVRQGRIPEGILRLPEAENGESSGALSPAGFAEKAAEEIRGTIGGFLSGSGAEAAAWDGGFSIDIPGRGGGPGWLIRSGEGGFTIMEKSPGRTVSGTSASFPEGEEPDLRKAGPSETAWPRDPAGAREYIMETKRLAGRYAEAALRAHSAEAAEWIESCASLVEGRPFDAPGDLPEEDAEGPGTACAFEAPDGTVYSMGHRPEPGEERAFVERRGKNGTLRVHMELLPESPGEGGGLPEDAERHRERFSYLQEPEEVLRVSGSRLGADGSRPGSGAFSRSLSLPEYIKEFGALQREADRALLSLLGEGGLPWQS